ncbi:hypothetical protein D9615_008329 [Tricholomella constricta]|uniref:Protein kinase domain-containing protein n=1 Tax=Tricholomella constricta TaxID=117010 RepID=A0A8H5HDL0_9AGAR|nr:hypothetical protein D9615_008329 [Tricholomella constricta]
MSSSKSSPRLILGKRIDHDSLEFVEVLGVGGYGVVYQAVETSGSNPQAYAVKCLCRSKEQPPVRRQYHIREIALHQISSAHPGIVTLHRVIEDHDNTYIIMDYAPDHDLFTQILNNCRYLGNDALIKHIFLQLIDALEYCHSLGIYHRDLKPENILCFEEGYRVAITDFGLATTEKMSGELHTGSIYHMSPECQGGAFAIDGSYSPMSNDVWSLGIILLNLATGRNPWRTATVNDVTFQAYLRDPLNFFPSVLPISLEINDILVQMLHVDWTQRATLAEIRQQMEDITTFYAPDVVFEGSQAQCAWEARAQNEEVTSSRVADPYIAPAEGLKSFWSDDSCSDIGDDPPQTSGSMVRDSDASAFVPEGLSIQVDRRNSWDSSTSSHLSYSTSPSTPSSADGSFANAGLVELTMGDMFEKTRQEDEYELSNMELGMFAGLTSSPSGFRPTPLVAMESISETDDLWATDGGSLDIPPPWAASAKRASSLSSTNSVLSSEITFARSMTPSPDTCTYSYSPSPPEAVTSYHNRDNKVMPNPMKLFRPTLFSSSAPQGSPLQHRTFESDDPWQSQDSNHQAAQMEVGSDRRIEAAPRHEVRKEGEGRPRVSRFGSAKNWFSSGKLFSTSLAS